MAYNFPQMLSVFYKSYFIDKQFCHGNIELTVESLERKVKKNLTKTNKYFARRPKLDISKWKAHAAIESKFVLSPNATF